MVSKNKYCISVGFDNKEHTKLFKGDVSYAGSKSFADKIDINQDYLKIEALRSSKVELTSVFYNHNSSLYGQLIKSLAYYYLIVGKYVEIKEIKVERSRQSKVLNQLHYSSKDFNQIVNEEYKLGFKIDKNKATAIFTEDEKGKNILNSVTHLITACCSIDEHEKFEDLWKSFNSLYRLIGKKDKEFDCLVETRAFVNSNSILFKHSLPTVKNIKLKEFRNKLRWRALIINNYPKEKDTKNYKNSILRYSDHRIMNVYKETIRNREQYLKNKGYYNEVINHLDKHIDAKTINDHELLSVLALRYMYFVRNKSFHGERIDSAFRLTINKESNEFEWLNQRLKPFIIDLLNMSDKY